MIRQTFIAGLLLSSSLANAGEWSGNLALQSRYFMDDPMQSIQHGNNLSVSAEAEWFHDWDGGDQRIVFTPFIRQDQHDDERSHADIRELSWQKVSRNWELRAGIRKVFWGVTESQHLVDIINQSDMVENPDGEDKLGQPMLNLALIGEWGTVDLFVLSYFRERTFPGSEGRLRSALPVDTDNVFYQSDDKEKHIDYAVRWVKSLGAWDMGLSHFYGTSRDPEFIAGIDANGNPVLFPYYGLIHQTGLDLQATLDSWLWKLELIRRSHNGESYNAATGGFEYTFYGVMESAADIGLVVEYLYDDRGDTASTPFQDDVMLGLRLAMNDAASTDALIGVIADRDSDARMLSIEASRRFGNNLKLSAEARWFNDMPVTDPLYSLQQDDYIQLELAYYF